MSDPLLAALVSNTLVSNTLVSNTLVSNTLVSNTLVASALGGLGWCLAHLAHRPASAHMVFVLALLKLVTPPLWQLDLACRDVASPSPRGSVVVGIAVPDDRSPLVTLRDADIAPAQRAPAPEQGSGATRAWTPWTVCVAIWLAGALIGASLVASRVRRMHRLLRMARAPDQTLERELRDAMRRVGLFRMPRVLVLGASIPPLVFVAGRRATLVVPEPLFARLGTRARVAVLTHELAHVRRGDVWLRWVETAIRVALWWHPLCRWLGGQLRAAEERACDAYVTAGTEPAVRRAYADALLAAATCDGRVPDFASPAVRARRRRMAGWKHRLEEVMTVDRSPGPSFAARALTLALGIVTLPLAMGQEAPAVPQAPLASLERIQIRFAVAGAPIGEWANTLAQAAGLNIVVDRTLVDAGPDAYALRDLALPETSVHRVLDVITALTDVRWEMIGPNAVRLYVGGHDPVDGTAADRPTIRVRGAVTMPGLVPIGDGQTLLELTARLPLTGSADLGAVRVTRDRADPPISVVVDVRRMIATGDTTHNLQLRNGDVVTVPELPDELPPLTLRPGVRVRFVVDPAVMARPGAEQLVLLCEPQRVQRDGTIFVPYVGPVHVDGLTRDELTAKVDQLLCGLFVVPVKVHARLD
ncbi:MAG: polysaccharide biosynthesis/export family protein [Planctomycetes bacterium]|nr:polysaccharide biosynthesis/export family protein [Planctomycetota bacterium]